MQLCGFEVGSDQPLFLIAGPCALESEALALEVADALAGISARTGVPIIFKASFDKANRSSVSGYRGPGMEAGLAALERVRSHTGLPVLTDVHEYTPVDEVAAVVDVLQTPAFLCRQTDYIQRVAAAGRPVNIKKGQFLAPWDMGNVVDKARAAGNERIMVCERGVSFGYNNLVSDMRGLAVMRGTGCPVVFDATHSVQLPGGQGSASGGQREFIPVLARAAVAAGVAGLFMETHPRPEEALSDGPNAWPLERLESLLTTLVALDRAVKAQPYAEQELLGRERVVTGTRVTMPGGASLLAMMLAWRFGETGEPPGLGVSAERCNLRLVSRARSGASSLPQAPNGIGHDGRRFASSGLRATMGRRAAPAPKFTRRRRDTKRSRAR